jgi:hypothetical protein
MDLKITLDFESQGFVDGTDSLELGEGAMPVFINDNGKPCALRYEGEHRLTFFAFMFEAIPDEVPVCRLYQRMRSPNRNR